MALVWDWENLSGTIEAVQGEGEYKLTLYEGNAFLIALYLHEEDGNQLYNLCWFFSDKEHAKRCLGLTKGHHNMFEGIPDKYRRMTIYREHCRNWKDIVDFFLKAMPDIEIVIREHKESDTHEE